MGMKRPRVLPVLGRLEVLLPSSVLGPAVWAMHWRVWGRKPSVERWQLPLVYGGTVNDRFVVT